MKTKHLSLIAVLVLTNVSLGFGQTTQQDSTPVRILRNGDVLNMVSSGLKPNVIIFRIQRSQCGFDTFPPVLLELRMRGVPEPVIRAMAIAPYGPASVGIADQDLRAKTIKVTIPAGTPINVESAFSVTSSEVEEGSKITFLVTRPIYINNSLAVARNAVATGRVIESKKAQGWGRPGSFTWLMEDVVAVDGVRVPVQVSESLRGRSRTPAVLVGAAATVALVFPYTSPAALVWAFRKGDEAVLFGSRGFTAIVSEETEIAGTPTAPFGAVRYLALKDRRSMTPAADFGSFNSSFRPSGSFLPGGSFLPSGSFRPNMQR